MTGTWGGLLGSALCRVPHSQAPRGGQRDAASSRATRPQVGGQRHGGASARILEFTLISPTWTTGPPEPVAAAAGIGCLDPPGPLNTSTWRFPKAGAGAGTRDSPVLPSDVRGAPTSRVLVGGEPASPGFCKDTTTVPAERETHTGFSPSPGPPPPGSLSSVCFPGRDSQGLTAASGFQPSLLPTGLPFFPWGLWVCVCPPCLLVPGDIAPSGRACGSCRCLVRSPLCLGPTTSKSLAPLPPVVLQFYLTAPKIFTFLGTRPRWEARIGQRARGQLGHEAPRLSEMLPPGVSLWPRASPAGGLPAMLGGRLRDMKSGRLAHRSLSREACGPHADGMWLVCPDTRVCAVGRSRVLPSGPHCPFPSAKLHTRHNDQVRNPRTPSPRRKRRTRTLAKQFYCLKNKCYI